MDIYYKKEYKKVGRKHPAKVLEHILIIADMNEQAVNKWTGNTYPLYAKIEGVRGVLFEVSIDTYDPDYCQRNAMDKGFVRLDKTDTVYLVLEQEVEKMIFWHRIKN